MMFSNDAAFENPLSDIHHVNRLIPGQFRIKFEMLFIDRRISGSKADNKI